MGDFRLCSIEGCGRIHRAKGYCDAHYKRAKLGKPMDAPLVRRWRPSWGVSERDHFWSFVDRSGGLDVCWLWQGGAGGCMGYGAFKSTSKGRLVQAHRFAWEIENGPIPEGMLVLHTCDTPLCVRPSHLYLGDQFANMADMVARGRARRTPWRCRSCGALRSGDFSPCKKCGDVYEPRRDADTPEAALAPLAEAVRP